MPKSIVYFVLALLVTAFTLSACGGAASSNSSESTMPAEDQAALQTINNQPGFGN